MLVTEFAKKYRFKGVDIKVAQKVYGNITMTEQEWFIKLKPDFAFEDDDKLRKIREAKEKKEKKNSKDN